MKKSVPEETRKIFDSLFKQELASARKAALEEAAKLAETPGVWTPHPDIPDCRRIATAIRALIERESKEG